MPTKGWCDCLAELRPDHPVWPYISIAHDLEFDTSLVDTFLHQRDQSYSIMDCVELVNSSELVFQDLFLKAPYYLPTTASTAFQSKLRGMPVQQQWSIMERINTQNSCHYFTACRADRARKSYKIDFDSAEAIRYIPSLRFRCNLELNRLNRNDWDINLDPIRLLVIEQIDGNHTIKDIMAAVSLSGLLPSFSKSDLETLGISIIEELWQLDFLAIGLKASLGGDAPSFKRS